MNTRLRQVMWLMVMLGSGPGMVIGLQAEPAVSLPLPSATKSGEKLPPMPMLKSPVDLFRDLLTMTPAERDHELANRPPEIRNRILAKVQEYAALKPEERDLRLRMTELRWYLLSVMNQPPPLRADALASVPEGERQSIADRLQQWDRLPRDEQKEILKYEKSMEHFMDQTVRGHIPVNHILSGPVPPLPPGAFTNLDNFLQLPPEQRQQMFSSFQRFFELTEAEKNRAVRLLPDSQRQQMATVLRSFDNLPKEAREERLRAFGKFSNLSASDRQEFMKNAARWRELPPAEREAWRSLVNRLPPSPPLPSGMVFPPMPPRPPLQASLPVSTNSVP